MGYLAELGEGGGRRAAVANAFERAIVPYEAALSERFLEGLRGIDAVRLYGIADTDRVDERTPTFAIRVGDQHPAETAKALAERGVFVWDGNYYALEIMERLGLQDSGGRSGSGSATTTPRTRWTGCSRSSRPWRSRASQRARVARMTRLPTPDRTWSEATACGS